MMLAHAWQLARFLILVAGLVAGLASYVRASVLDVEQARERVAEIGHQILEVLGDSELEQAVQDQRLKELLGRAIDFEIAGRLILAKHWRTATEDQRAAYTELFRPYALDNLASKMQAANAEVPLSGFEIVGQQASGKNDIVISTDLFWPGYRPYRMDWRLRLAEGGELRAIDVRIEDISMVISQRSEFATVIERQGIDGLIDKMRKQVAAGT